VLVSNLATGSLRISRERAGSAGGFVIQETSDGHEGKRLCFQVDYVTKRFVS
jgi:hypothetical protein